MGYRVKFEDIGFRGFKETWDYQTSVFNKLIDDKQKRGPLIKKPTDYTPGTLIFVEHPGVYTLGKSGSGENLLINNIQLKSKNVEFYRIDRGGDITFHGPGQIVGYPIFDLEIIKIGIREYILRIEEAIIRSAGPEHGMLYLLPCQSCKLNIL